ncbi:MAG: hypothetical protein FJW36_24850 [Acidobacteria bacterium]|nr:hypothetical protein [Acidobacteriota bacterium]
MLLALCALVTLAQFHDIVIRNGRVIVPESGLDAIRNVGIRAGKIAAISRNLLKNSQRHL